MGWRGEVRGPHFQEGRCATLVFAMESRRFQLCPDVKRSTLRPPAQGGERFLSGHFNRAWEGVGRRWNTEQRVEMVEKLRRNIYKPVACEW